VVCFCVSAEGFVPGLNALECAGLRSCLCVILKTGNLLGQTEIPLVVMLFSLIV